MVFLVFCCFCHSLRKAFFAVNRRHFFLFIALKKLNALGSVLRAANYVLGFYEYLLHLQRKTRRRQNVEKVHLVLAKVQIFSFENYSTFKNALLLVSVSAYSFIHVCTQ